MPNAAPVAVNDGTYSTLHGHMLSVTAANGMLANDTDADNDTLTTSIVAYPSHGMLMPNSNGSFTYSPNSTYTGSDSFTYHAYDGTAYSSTATVSLSVTNSAPVAVNDGTYNAHANHTLSVSAGSGLLANDSDADGDTLTMTIVANPSHGMVMPYTDGSFFYWFIAEFSG